jgi:integrase
MGTVFRRKRKLKNGTVLERPTWWMQYYQHGRQVRESARTASLAVAKRILRQREGDVDKGITVDPKAGRFTFEEGAEALLNDYRNKRCKTLQNTAYRIWTHLAPARCDCPVGRCVHFRWRRLASITTTQIEAWKAARQRHTIRTRKARTRRQRDGVWLEEPEQRKAVSAGEINRELATLKRIFSIAKDQGHLYQIPKITMLREGDARRGFFEREPFEAVRAHLPAPEQAVITFAYLTGWRMQSEILSLEWRQIDWSGREVRLDPGTTKNREGRTYPFTDELEQVLRTQWAEHEQLRQAGRVVPIVFHRNGRPIRTFRRSWRSACRQAGVPGRILHDFRRTAVRNLERAGVPRSAAMAMVGHKTESIYRRYAIVDAAVLREAALKINRVAGERPGTKPGTRAGDPASTGGLKRG